MKTESLITRLDYLIYQNRELLNLFTKSIKTPLREARERFFDFRQSAAIEDTNQKPNQDTDQEHTMVSPRGDPAQTLPEPIRSKLSVGSLENQLHRQITEAIHHKTRKFVLFVRFAIGMSV